MSDNRRSTTKVRDYLLDILVAVLVLETGGVSSLLASKLGDLTDAVKQNTQTISQFSVKESADRQDIKALFNNQNMMQQNIHENRKRIDFYHEKSR